jgi:hypothetical protein
VSPTPSSEDGNRPSFRNIEFSRISDDGQNLKTPAIPSVIHHYQNPLRLSFHKIEYSRYDVPSGMFLDRQSYLNSRNVIASPVPAADFGMD